MAPIVFVSPFSNTENAYIERQQEILRALGCDVRPLSLGALLRGRCGGLASRRNAVVVSWLENRIFTPGRAQRGVSARGLAEFSLYVAVLAFARARVVFVHHDHEVHDPSVAERYDADYLPHPLYDEPEPLAGSPRPMCSCWATATARTWSAAPSSRIGWAWRASDR